VTLSTEVKKDREEKKNGRVLRSERTYGFTSRSFTVSCPIDEAKADAHYENGILDLTLPKKGGSAAKRLSVH
jgi:HSP20 family protein